MAYTGGTAVARECIARLTELGALVDVYSKQWLSKHPNFPHFSEEDFAEYQSKSNNACEGHLLVISTSLDLPAISSLLPAAHPGFVTYFGERARYHKPDLILSTWPHDKFCVLVSAGKITSSASPLMLTK